MMLKMMVVCLAVSGAYGFLVGHYLNSKRRLYRDFSVLSYNRDVYYNTCVNILRMREYHNDEWYKDHVSRDITIHQYYEQLLYILDKCIHTIRVNQHTIHRVGYDHEFSLIDDGVHLPLLDFMSIYY